MIPSLELFRCFTNKQCTNKAWSKALPCYVLKESFIYSPPTFYCLETKLTLNFAKIIGTRNLQEIRLDGKTKETRLSRKAKPDKIKS